MGWSRISYYTGMGNVQEMIRRRLESDTRLRYLLGNNPLGELIRIIYKGYERNTSNVNVRYDKP